MILAAGLGTRMRPLTLDRAKPAGDRVGDVRVGGAPIALDRRCDRGLARPDRDLVLTRSEDRETGAEASRTEHRHRSRHGAKCT
jgi:hypothetical protein